MWLPLMSLQYYLQPDQQTLLTRIVNSSNKYSKSLINEENEENSCGLMNWTRPSKLEEIKEDDEEKRKQENLCGLWDNF